MKKLSVEEKAKRYDEAIETAIKINSGESVAAPSDWTICEVIFPELTESEDEGMLREIKRYIKEQGDKPTGLPNGTAAVADMIAWLEKQGESKPIGKLQLSEELYEHIRNTCACIDDAFSSETLADINDYLSMAKHSAQSAFDMIEKQGEKKSEKWDVAAIAKLADEYYDTLIKESNMSYNMATRCKLAFFHGADAMLKKTQCEQELWNEKDKNMLKWITGYLDNKMLNTPIVEERTACKNAIVWLEKLEDKQKPADKVEPKFKVGDWVVSPNGVYWHIDAINNNRYEVSSTDGACADWPLDTDLYHLWTIQDAKDGDVLKEDSCIFIIEKMNPNGMAKVHCCLFDDGEFDLVGSTLVFDKDSTYPATKEQRDQLEKAMADAGYTFDFEKKELKKIEQKPNYCHHEVDLSGCSEEYCKAYYDGWNNCNQQHAQLEAEQKPSWSEEDEKMLNQIIKDYERGNESWLKGQGSLPFGNRIIWLKSLKERYT